MYIYMSLDVYLYICVCTHMCVVTMSYLPFADHQSIPELRKKTLHASCRQEIHVLNIEPSVLHMSNQALSSWAAPLTPWILDVQKYVQ